MPDPVRHIVRALQSGFAYQGEPSAHRNGAPAGDSGHLPPTSFVSFLQNHDQIGNRPGGERLDVLAPAAAIEAALAVFCCASGAPQPLLFMGEDWANSSVPLLLRFSGQACGPRCVRVVARSSGKQTRTNQMRIVGSTRWRSEPFAPRFLIGVLSTNRQGSLTATRWCAG